MKNLIRFLAHWFLLAWNMRKDAWSAREWKSVHYILMATPNGADLRVLADVIGGALSELQQPVAREEDVNVHVN